mmetsp:Transcript_48005/g.93766  ORF Transcript_48005/g.93766 Transcript_48005/m.93766 type:complete len:204 (-) Transcript_48005:1728-2339(-)
MTLTKDVATVFTRKLYSLGLPTTADVTVLILHHVWSEPGVPGGIDGVLPGVHHQLLHVLLVGPAIFRGSVGCIWLLRLDAPAPVGRRRLHLYGPDNHRLRRPASVSAARGGDPQRPDSVGSVAMPVPPGPVLVHVEGHVVPADVSLFAPQAVLHFHGLFRGVHGRDSAHSPIPRACAHLLALGHADDVPLPEGSGAVVVLRRW